MIFKISTYPTEHENIDFLAPIPMFSKQFKDDELHQEVFDFGFNNLTEQQKQMGQELPEQYDTERAKIWNGEYLYGDQWIEPTDQNPIGSRFYVPPNNFLDIDHPGIKILRDRIIESYCYTLDKLNYNYTDVILTESWIQYYEPTSGRGHNKHNHCRWSHDEFNSLGFSGGYYLSDGEPVKDHPYSGAFTFHIREHSHFIRPKKGLLLIWPNDIVHSVKPFYGKTHRCVINFNIQSKKVR
jgi:hypothetical protein